MFKVRFTPKYLAYAAILAALSTLANIFSIHIPAYNNYLSFAYIPTFLAGIYLGVPGGFFVGLIGDILGCIIAPKGAWLPLITLASALMGAIPGIVFYFFKKRDSEMQSILKRNLALIISAILVLIICTMGLNTYNLWLVYSATKKTFWVYLFGRLPWQALVLVINTIIIGVLVSIPEVDLSLKKLSDQNI